MASKRIMIVEPASSGHHMALYVRYAIRALVSEGWEISILTSKNAASSAAFEIAKKEFSCEPKIYLMPDLVNKGSANPFSKLLSQLLDWWALRTAFRRANKAWRPDIVYVPTIDWVAKASELVGSPFGRVPFVALYLSPKHHFRLAGLGGSGRQERLYKQLFGRFLRIKSLKQLLVVDELFYDVAGSLHATESKKVKFIPDFAEVRGEWDRKRARQAYGLAPSDKVVLVYGGLTERKGICQLLSAVTDESVDRNVAVLLAGKPSCRIASLLESPEYEGLIARKRIIARLEFHDSSEEQKAFVASDAVWLGYVDGFLGSSGVLYQSIHCGKPVIAMRGGVIGRTVTKNQIGFCVNPDSTAEVAAALNDFPTLERIASERRNVFVALAARHSAEAHMAMLQSVVGSPVESPQIL